MNSTIISDSDVLSSEVLYTTEEHPMNEMLHVILQTSEKVNQVQSSRAERTNEFLQDLKESKFPQILYENNTHWDVLWALFSAICIGAFFVIIGFNKRLQDGGTPAEKVGETWVVSLGLLTFVSWVLFEGCRDCVQKVRHAFKKSAWEKKKKKYQTLLSNSSWKLNKQEQGELKSLLVNYDVIIGPLLLECNKPNIFISNEEKRILFEDFLNNYIQQAEDKFANGVYLQEKISCLEVDLQKQEGLISLFTEQNESELLSVAMETNERTKDLIEKYRLALKDAEQSVSHLKDLRKTLLGMFDLGTTQINSAKLSNEINAFEANKEVRLGKLEQAKVLLEDFTQKARVFILTQHELSSFQLN